MFGLDYQEMVGAALLLGIGLLITGAISIPEAKFNQSKGCELKKKLSLTNQVLPDVAQLEYDLCQKEASLSLKWSVPVLVIGAMITAICGILIAIDYYRQRRRS